jgi:hypothetical protein
MKMAEVTKIIGYSNNTWHFQGRGGGVRESDTKWYKRERGGQPKCNFLVHFWTYFHCKKYLKAIYVKW